MLTGEVLDFRVEKAEIVDVEPETEAAGTEAEETETAQPEAAGTEAEETESAQAAE